jgi:hypothetical protein
VRNNSLEKELRRITRSRVPENSDDFLQSRIYHGIQYRNFLSLAE